MTVHRFPTERRRRLKVDTPQPIARLGGRRRRCRDTWPTRAALAVGAGLILWLGYRIADEMLFPQQGPVIVHKGTSVGDLDCADFATRWQVRRFIRDNPDAAKTHRLDRDGDGAACEWLPRFTLW